MRRLVIVIVAILTVLIGCQKKATPVITARKAAPPEMLSSPYAPEGSVKADTLAGRQVYMSKCNRCHGLPDIKAYDEVRWENTLLSMLPRAGVDKTNAVHVRAYVLAVLAR